jgi:hypothetical protein
MVVNLVAMKEHKMVDLLAILLVALKDYLKELQKFEMMDYNLVATKAEMKVVQMEALMAVN